MTSSHKHNHCLFSRFLTYCPSKRILSEEGLKHEYFREKPLPIEPSMFPTWPAKSEQQRVKRGTSPRPPEGGLGYSQLVRTLGSTFSITYIHPAVWKLSVLNRLQTYRLLLYVRVVPPCVFHDENLLVPNAFRSGPAHPELRVIFFDQQCWLFQLNFSTSDQYPVVLVGNPRCILVKVDEPVGNRPWDSKRPLEPWEILITLIILLINGFTHICVCVEYENVSIHSISKGNQCSNGQCSRRRSYHL